MQHVSASPPQVPGISQHISVLEVIHNRIQNITSRLESAANQLHGTYPMPPQGMIEKICSSESPSNIQELISQIIRDVDRLEAAENRVNHGNGN